MMLKTLSEGIRFAFSPKVIVPYLILDMMIVFTLIHFFVGFFDFTTVRPQTYNLVLFLGIYLPTFIIISLLYLWVSGAVIDQARYFPKSRSLAKSFGYSGSRYMAILCALILQGIIITIASSPPYIGPLISFVVSLFLFYLFQAIIIDKKGCIDSFKRSFSTFSTYPLEIFVFDLMIIAISLIVAILFALPLLIFVLGRLSVIPGITIPYTSDTSMIRNLIPELFNAIRSPYFIIYLFIFCVGLAYTSAFQEGVKTRLYINTRKHEL